MRIVPPSELFEIRDGNSQISLRGKGGLQRSPEPLAAPGPRPVPTLPVSVGQKPKARVGAPKGEEKRLC